MKNHLNKSNEKVILLEKQHIVVSYPHPDDESFGASGVIYEANQTGVPVTYLCGTLGEMGRNMGTPPIANRESLAEIRREELKEACEYLGINYQLLGYRDKAMEFENKTKMAEHIKSILEEIEPSVVITHYPGYGVHPDHNAQGAATIEAVRLMDKDKRPVVWASAITHDFVDVLGEPDVVIDANKNFDFKLNAILKHRSQAEAMLKRMEADEEFQTTYTKELKDRLGLERFYIWDFEGDN